MFSFETRRQKAHRGKIQRIGMVVNVSKLKRITNFRPKDPVFIGLRDGIEPRMKFRMHLFHIAHPNRRGQKAIDRAPQIISWYRIIKRNRCHLGASMHPGIGASRTLHAHRPTLNPTNHRFQSPLNSSQIRLDLPPMEIRPIVANRKPYPPVGQSPRTAPDAPVRLLLWRVQAAREPGFTAVDPSAQRGHCDGS
jgi:hypothetical protein